MSLDAKTVAKVASLARIKLTEDELTAMSQELNHIIGWVEQLGELNTDDVDPMVSVVPIALKQRKDEVTDGGIREKILTNAPEATQGYFVVPKVVE